MLDAKLYAKEPLRVPAETTEPFGAVTLKCLISISISFSPFAGVWFSRVFVRYALPGVTA
jgi:hypothetical protein